MLDASSVSLRRGKYPDSSAKIAKVLRAVAEDFDALLNGNVLGVWLAVPLNDAIIILIAVILLIGEYKHLIKLARESGNPEAGEML